MADDYDPDRLRTEPAPSSASMRVRPALSRDEIEKLVRRHNPDITPAAVQGEADNIQRESGGKSAVPGDYEGGRATSGGLYQDHNERLTALKAYASKQGKDWTDPDTQVAYARIEKERDYPALLKLQQTTNDRNAAEDSFKRVFERPASVLWGNDARGQPVQGSEGYRFSDHALSEHDGRSDVDLHMMDPQEYLDLSPEFGGAPFQNPAGRALRKSFDRGEPIESVPTLDVNVEGPTATVTDQDGRHRALLAQEQGVEAIPVAIRKTGTGDPKEIVGTNGVPQAFDFPKAQGRQPYQPTPEQPKEPISLFGQIGQALMPSAAAAEVPREGQGQPADANPFLSPEYHEQPAQAAQAGPQPGPQAAPAQAGPDANPFMSPEYHEASTGQGGGQTPVAEMTQEQAQAAHLTPEQQDEWMKTHQGGGLGNLTNALEVAAFPATWPAMLGRGLAANAAPIGRGLAPYAVGAGVGAAAGAPFAGVGAIPGAAAGAAAVGLDQMATSLAGLPTPSDATNKLLDVLGVGKSDSAASRMIENAVAGAANAFSGAGAMTGLANALKNPLSKAVATLLGQKPVMQAISGASAGGAQQGAAELGLPAWAQQLTGFVGGLLPGGRELTPNIWRQDVSDAARDAIKLGLAIPPGEAAPGHIGKMSLAQTAASESGKIKTGQMASAVNQPRVNVLMREQLGVPDGTPLTPDVLRGVRAREGQVYNEVANAVPEVDLGKDPTFRADVAGLGKRSESTEAAFPSTKEPPEIPALRKEMLAHSRAGTKDVMNYLGDLRARANQMFRVQNDAMAHRKGYAMREAATALEDAMERSVQNAPAYYADRIAQARQNLDQIMKERADQGISATGKVVDDAKDDLNKWVDLRAKANAANQGNQTLLDRFRKARRTMAQSYDIEAVANPSSGDVSATGLGRLLRKGKPLTGNMLAVANAANNFHRAFQNPAAFGGVEPLSVLDLAFSAAQGAKALATGSVAHAIAAAMPLLRPFIREGVTSPTRQNAMIAPYRRPTAPLSAFTTPLVGTRPTGNALAGMENNQ